MFITKKIHFFSLLFISSFILVLSSCGKKENRAQDISPSVSTYVYGYTSGIISKTASIRIQFTTMVVNNEQVGQTAANGMLSFSPAVKGNFIWENEQTLRFDPDPSFVSSTAYVATVNLKNIIENVPKEAQSFEFDFRIRDQYLTMNFKGFSSEDSKDLSVQQLTGSLKMADYAEPETIEKIITASQKGKNLAISWQHDPAQLVSEFFIESIHRGEKISKVNVNWSGKSIGSVVSGHRDFEVPVLGDFKVIDISLVNDQDKYILFNFSDPLLANQNLNGLVSMSDYSGNFRYLVEGNFLRVYPSGHLAGEHNITVSTLIKNAAGRNMKKPSSWNLNFETAKPEVKLTGNGVILPNSDGLIFPFQAIGLNQIEVEVFKIFNNNILQFLQSNDIDNNRSYMEQVGRIIMRKQIPLQNLSPSASPDNWSNYALDLSKLIKQDKEAIYQIRIGYRPEFATYFCNATTQIKDKSLTLAEEEPDLENSMMNNWYGPNGWYDNYSWTDREDPCKPAYYNSDRFVRRNVLASNLGIIVKGSDDKTYAAIITDLRSAKPLPGVSLHFYDFQQQILGTTKTNGQGIATITLEREPFVVVAKSNNDHGYLKLQDGRSLSMSRFNVSGTRAQKGMKGFIYGDRGVWRPGDSVFINLILENKKGELPANYPVTMTVTDPRGQLIEKRSTATNFNGIYPLYFKTSSESPTGNWSVTVKAGGASFYKSLKIETVKPNRLKIDLDFGADKLNAINDLNGNITAKWLHGAPAANLKAKVEVELKAVKTTFDGHENYTFDDPARKISSTARTIFDGNLDENGHAQIQTKLLNNKLVSGKLKASFKSRVFEKGGDFSADNFSLSYSPFDVYAGISLPKNNYGSNELQLKKDEQIDFTAISENGKPLANRALKVGLYRVQWRWWWDYGYDRVSRYNSSNHYDAKETASITTDSKGRANWSVNIKEWGRFLVRVCDTESGHCSGDFFYAGYPDGNQDNNKAAAMLNFSADKEKYNIGETVKLTIPTGKTGRALISIENGSKVLQSFWAEATEGKNEFTFETTTDMAPNVYAHVTLIQEHGQVFNDLPIRLYGVIPILVENKKTHLKPTIKMADQLRPQEKFNIEISEENGREMAYTIDIVDEGLLGLTRFKTPAPWNTFYAKEALGVQTWDMYNYVLGAYGGKLEQILSIGGDGAIVNPAAEESANRFKAVVMHLGPFVLKKGKKAKHQIEMPNYVGAVRAMVVAANSSKAYGHAEKVVPVKKPLMVLATLPRILSPGEEILLPVNVFVMDKKVRNATVKVVESSGLVTFIDSNTESISFSKPGDKIVYFKVKVKENVGIAKFTISAEGAGEKSTQDIEIQVRNPNPYTTTVHNQVIAGGESWDKSFNPVGMAGTNEGVLEVSSIPPINLGQRLQYLLRYPYGCIEQTLSGGFPQLYVNKLMELDEHQKESIPDHVRATIGRLKLFQTGTGGFGYWPGNTTPSHWSTSYAGHFLLEAKALGYTVMPSMLDNWAKFQKKVARMWKIESSQYGFYSQRGQELNQAYRLYTLALYGKPELGAMNRLRESSQLTLQARWRLAAAYALSGKKDIAQQLVKQLSTEVKSYRELSYTFGSDTRDRAMILETLVLLDDKIKAATVLKYLSDELSSQRWHSTQTIAFSLLAIGKYVGHADIPKNLQFTYKIGNGKSINAGSKTPVMQLVINVDEGKHSVSVQNPGNSPLFARVILSGQALPGNEEARSNDLRLSVNYTDMKGNTLDPTSLKQGTDFLAEVIIRHPDSRPIRFDEMALCQVFPSGWEIANTRMDAVQSFQSGDAADYQDFRDDRVNTFFDINRNKTKVYRVQLTAAYQGRFYLPAISCEAMYDHSINANTEGMWVEVGEAVQ